MKGVGGGGGGVGGEEKCALGAQAQGRTTSSKFQEAPPANSLQAPPSGADTCPCTHPSFVSPHNPGLPQACPALLTAGSGTE